MPDRPKKIQSKILIVTDDSNLLSEAEHLLSGWGYAVTGMHGSGGGIMEAVTREKPSLVLLDMALGRQTAVQTADRLRSNRRIPVVFLVSGDQAPLLGQANPLHPCGHVMKPIEPNALKASVEMGVYLGRIEAERDRAQKDLRQYQDHLEELVDARTQALTAGHDALKRELAECETAQTALKASEQNLRTLIEQTPVGILTIDNDGFVTDANPISFQLLGSPSRESIIGLNVLTMPSLVKSGLVQFFKSVLATGEPQDIEAPYTSVWGKQFFLRSRLVPQHDPHGNQIGLIQLLEDITPQKQAEEALQKLSQAVEQSPTSVVITDLDGRIEYVNPKFTEVTGFTYDEAIGQNPSILKSGHHGTEHYTDLWKTITEGRIWRGEILNRKKNGVLYWEFASISSVKNDRGEVTHFVAVKEDISDRKRTEAELQLAKDSAERANKAKSDFLASMSHEIRTPMNAIIGMTDLTLQSCMDSELRDNMITIKDSANHLLSIINDILDLSKIEAGRIELEETDFDLFENLQAALRTVEIPAVKKGLDLKLDIGPETPRFVKGDPVRLRQVLVNLLGNALKFTPEGGIYLKVRPEKRSEDTRLHFSVRDTGIGIPEDKLEEIFMAFSQAEGSTTRRFGGTGLGLAICKRLVEMMGGRIEVESRYGEGSEFFFSSVFEESDSSRVDCGKPVFKEQTAAGITTLRVLLAEDNPVNAKVAQKFLTRLGYTIDTAPDGKQAIDILSKGWFDLVLMDVEMPDMDGVEATRRIRSGEAGERNRRIPIIAITAHVLPEFRNQAQEVGMNDFVTKPVDFYELNTIIGRTVPDLCCPAHLSRQEADDRKPGPVINRQDALRRMGGDRKLLDELIEIFLQDVPAKLKALKQSVAASNFEETKNIAHSVKGAAGSIGADSVQDAAFRLERMARDEREEGVRISSAVLERELEGIRVFFNK